MIRSFFYLILISALMLGAGYLVAGRQGLLFSFVVAFVLAIISYVYSQDIILWTYSAVSLEGADPHNLNKKVTELAKKTGISKPTVYIVPGQTPNAFSLGRSLKNSAIGITEGTLSYLNEKELDSVLAFLVCQIQNQQTGLKMFSACLSSFVMYVAQFFKWMVSFGADDSNRRRPRLSGNLLEALFAPLGGAFVKLSLGKSQYYIADGATAELTQNSQALATTLWKLHHYGTAMPMLATPSTGHLFIVNPNENYGFNWLFNIHPKVDDRIKRLIGRTL